MSLNKVLNRPLFRKEALRKGALKVIKASSGDMIGPMPMMGPTAPPRRTFGQLMSSGLRRIRSN